MKYRKKPVIVDAWKWDGTGEGASDIIDKAFEAGSTRDMSWGAIGFLIHTLEGTMEASKGDFIILGVSGEPYPCKPDIFKMTYEAV